ncbi:triose-phosphate isomerase family protein [Streptomyces sp. NPDC050610]|uniref:triose-phosphate isomerase family protein n=1 Tax=Streptomyces sp. NPDC050610 TaxID=3157097 RepID=UPI00342A3EC4
MNAGATAGATAGAEAGTGPRPVVGVSLKLYMGVAETRRWLAEVAELAREATGGLPVELFVLPSFPSLTDAREVLAGTGVAYGAQDLHWADSGPWTGEVSGGQLAELGASYVEVGHAERRRHFGEDDGIVAAKTAAAVRRGLTPVICAGDSATGDSATADSATADSATADSTAGDSAAGALDAAIAETLGQVDAALSGAAGGEVVIAYEPVWAIGADRPAPAVHVRAVTAAIRRRLTELGVRGRVIYGGTAGPGTFTELTAPDADGVRAPLDGLFLGRLAHDTANLRKVLAEVASRPPAGAP